MRLLTVPSMVLTALALLVAPPLHGAGSCEKDVFIYFDVSGSMRDRSEGVSTLELFTSAVEALLAREDFIDPKDHVSIFVFAEGTAPLVVDGDKTSALRSVHELRESNPLGPTFSGPPSIGNPNRTNIGSVIDDVTTRVDSSRHQIFIIASDFADDPGVSACNQIDARVSHVKNVANEASASFTVTPMTKLILLTSRVHGDQCGGAHQRVADDATGALEDILHAARVEITRRPSIAGSLRQAAAEPVVLQGGDIAANGEGLSIGVQNPNPFGVLLQTLRLSTPDGTAEEESPNKTIPCKSRVDVTITPSTSLLEKPSITVTPTVKDLPPSPSVALPSRQITILLPEFHVFNSVARDAYIIQGDIAANVDGKVVIQLDSADGIRRTYEVPAGPERAPFALALDTLNRETMRSFRLSLTGGKLYVNTKGAAARPAEYADVHHGEDRLGEVFLSATQWSSVIALIFGLLTFSFHRARHLFEFTHTTIHFAEALVGWIRRGGRTACLTLSVLPYGYLRSTTPENVTWSLLIFLFTLWVLRRIAVACWPLFEKHLRRSKDVLKIRKYVTTAVVLLALVTSVTGFLLLNSTVPPSPIIRPTSTTAIPAPVSLS